MHLANFARRNLILSRSREGSGKICRRDGNDGAGAAFVEEGELGGRSPVDGYGCTKAGKSRSVTPRGTRGFGMTSVRLVRHRGEASGGEGDEAIDEALLGGEVNGGRLAGDNAGDGFGVFGGREFACEFRSGEWRVASGERGRSSRFLAALGM